MKKISVVALPFAIGLLLSLAGPTQADPGPGNFGQHASSCAKTMGFSAAMNPGMHHGMHHGVTDWDGMVC